MRPDLMTLSVDDIMSRNPKVIDRGSLASEALALLNSAKITTLIVTEADKPVGIIHLHDLLRAGVA
jgi:arabinose-5-phosphate isomerase